MRRRWPRFLTDPKHRPEAWKLHRYCKEYGQQPIDVFLGSALRYDFGQGVMTLATTIEAKAREVDQVEVADGPKPSKGNHFEQRPRYTMHELLFEPMAAADKDDDAETDALFAHLPTANL